MAQYIANNLELTMLNRVLKPVSLVAALLVGSVAAEDGWGFDVKSNIAHSPDLEVIAGSASDWSNTKLHLGCDADRQRIHIHAKNRTNPSLMNKGKVTFSFTGPSYNVTLRGGKHDGNVFRVKRVRKVLHPLMRSATATITVEGDSPAVMKAGLKDSALAIHEAMEACGLEKVKGTGGEVWTPEGGWTSNSE